MTKRFIIVGNECSSAQWMPDGKSIIFFWDFDFEVDTTFSETDQYNWRYSKQDVTLHV